MNLTEVILSSTNSVGVNSLYSCHKLINVMLPYATYIGDGAFQSCYALRHITVHPIVDIAKFTFWAFLSLEVLATCAGFELDTGDRHPDGDLDPTVAITRYLSRNVRRIGGRGMSSSPTTSCSNCARITSIRRRGLFGPGQRSMIVWLTFSSTTRTQLVTSSRSLG